jgi:hypothetical protein
MRKFLIFNGEKKVEVTNAIIKRMTPSIREINEGLAISDPEAKDELVTISPIEISEVRKIDIIYSA